MSAATVALIRLHVRAARWSPSHAVAIADLDVTNLVDVDGVSDDQDVVPLIAIEIFR